MAKSYWSHAALYSSLAAALAGCGTVPEKTDLPAPVAEVPASPPPKSQEPSLKLEAASRSGNADSYVVFGRRYRVRETSEGYREQGIASWYGKDFHGRKTSSGPLYNMFDLTAAHKSLPIPTYVRVNNLENGRSVVVKVNDRGPFVGQRIIDLSYAAANRLGMLGKGTAQVEVTAVEPYQLLPKLAALRAQARQQAAIRLPESPPAAPPAVASAPVSPLSPLTAASAPSETPKRPMAEPVAPATQPPGSSSPVARAQPTVPAIAEPVRSGPIAVRAETPQPSVKPPLRTQEELAANAGAAPARVAEAPALDVPAPRLIASAEERLTAEGASAKDKPAVAHRAKAGRSSSAPAERRNARAPVAQAARKAPVQTRLEARATPRPAVTPKATLAGLAGAKNRSRPLSD